MTIEDLRKEYKKNITATEATVLRANLKSDRVISVYAKHLESLVINQAKEIERTKLKVVDVEDNWKDFWLPIISKDGKVDMELIKLELSDYYSMLQEVPEVYCHITGSRISKPNTLAECVIAEADRHYEEIYRESDD